MGSDDRHSCHMIVTDTAHNHATSTPRRAVCSISQSHAVLSTGVALHSAMSNVTATVTITR